MRIAMVGMCLIFALGIGMAKAPAAWRSGWIGGAPAAGMATLATRARALGFHALIFSAPLDKLPGLVEQVREGGLESYYWFGPQAPAQNPGAYWQVMSAEEQEVYAALLKDGERFSHGYQGGGEPLPGRVDVWEGKFPCFHHATVRQATLEQLRAVLRACPTLTGIALDGFGYQNLHDCRCAESERQAKAFAERHPALSPGAARERFYYETLVAFQNELIAEARRVHPGIKLTAHIWPTYLPRPLYGNAVNLDYAAQTAAWFFQPYWDDAKITTYTRHIVRKASAHFRRQQGVPFVGYASGPTAGEKKAPERLAHELRTIFRATPSRSLSIFVFDDLLGNPEASAALESVFREFGIIK